MPVTMSGSSDGSRRRRAAYAKGRADLAEEILKLLRQNKPKLVLERLRAEVGLSDASEGQEPLKDEGVG
jgi:hypothetical protein